MYLSDIIQYYCFRMALERPGGPVRESWKPLKIPTRPSRRPVFPGFRLGPDHILRSDGVARLEPGEKRAAALVSRHCPTQNSSRGHSSLRRRDQFACPFFAVVGLDQCVALMLIDTHRSDLAPKCHHCEARFFKLGINCVGGKGMITRSWHSSSRLAIQSRGLWCGRRCWPKRQKGNHGHE